jgi:predicted  nucleic acid-binding Zn-ribbon protein
MTLEAIQTQIEAIQAQIAELSERRSALWRQLAEGHDGEIARELKALDAELARLYDVQRATRARMRFGDRSEIVARARMEERLERAA